MLPDLSRFAAHWRLDPAVAMLNHGSFGACPQPVLERQTELREQMEREPVRFFLYEMEPLLDHARAALAQVVGAEPADLVFVRNATAAVNGVLRSLHLAPGDEILVTNHGYNACRNAADWVAERGGTKVVVAEVPCRLSSPEQALDAIVARCGRRTRLALVDWITSPTAVVFPIARLVEELERRAVATFVDAAHAPGMVEMDLRSLGASYVAGNCHKWLCGPKGSGFLWVRADRQRGIHPAVVSHGYNQRRPGRNRLHDEFDWTGTDDPTPWLCLPAAIALLESYPGGLRGLRERNRALAVEARRMLCGALGLEPLCPESMLASMAAMGLPDDPDPRAWDMSIIPSPVHRLQRRLLDEQGIEVPIHYWPGPPRRVIRVSAQAYNSLEQYGRLAAALEDLLHEG